MKHQIKTRLYSAKIATKTIYTDYEVDDVYFTNPIIFPSDEVAKKTYLDAVNDNPDVRLIAIYKIADFDVIGGKIINSTKRSKIYEKEAQQSEECSQV